MKVNAQITSLLLCFTKMLFALFVMAAAPEALGQDNVVVQWDNATLQEIRYFHPGPTINSRSLAIVHTCMFDAWTAFDDRAIPTALSVKFRRPATERTELNKRAAVSYAAYRCLSDLFPTEVAKFQILMTSLGLDASDQTTNPEKPSGIGNLAAQAVLDARHHDGSNQLGDSHPGAYTDYTGYTPINGPDHFVDPDRWQPLRTPIPDHVMYGKFIVQKYQTPHWAFVKPFALTSGAQFRPQRRVWISIAGPKNSAVRVWKGVHHLSDGGRDGHKNGHFGLVAIEQQAVALEAVSLQGHSIENGEPGPAHSGESMLPGAKERLVEIAVSSPFSVGIGAVNDLREF